MSKPWFRRELSSCFGSHKHSWWSFLRQKAWSLWSLQCRYSSSRTTSNSLHPWPQNSHSCSFTHLYCSCKLSWTGPTNWARIYNRTFIARKCWHDECRFGFGVCHGKDVSGSRVSVDHVVFNALNPLTFEASIIFLVTLASVVLFNGTLCPCSVQFTLVLFPCSLCFALSLRCFSSCFFLFVSFCGWVSFSLSCADVSLIWVFVGHHLCSHVPLLKLVLCFLVANFPTPVATGRRTFFISAERLVSRFLLHFFCVFCFSVYPCLSHPHLSLVSRCQVAPFLRGWILPVLRNIDRFPWLWRQMSLIFVGWASDVASCYMTQSCWGRRFSSFVPISFRLLFALHPFALFRPCRNLILGSFDLKCGTNNWLLRLFGYATLTSELARQSVAVFSWSDVCCFLAECKKCVQLLRDVLLLIAQPWMTVGFFYVVLNSPKFVIYVSVDCSDSRAIFISSVVDHTRKNW